MNASNLIAAAKSAALLAAAALIALAPHSHAEPLPACQYEDGNTNGQACMWTDPDSGTEYYVDSSNYR